LVKRLCCKKEEAMRLEGKVYHIPSKARIEVPFQPFALPDDRFAELGQNARLLHRLVAEHDETGVNAAADHARRQALGEDTQSFDANELTNRLAVRSAMHLQERLA
jgi:hypothetical protein